MINVGTNTYLHAYCQRHLSSLTYIIPLLGIRIMTTTLRTYIKVQNYPYYKRRLHTCNVYWDIKNVIYF